MSRLLRQLRLWLCLYTLGLGVAQADPVDFELVDLDGHTVRLADYRGQWVIVNFWASWCDPCTRDLPELVRYQDANPQARVIGINLEETSVEHTRDFVRRFAVNFPILKINEAPLLPFEPLEGLPSTVVIDPIGRIKERHLGPLTAGYLQTLIDLHADRTGLPGQR